MRAGGGAGTPASAWWRSSAAQIVTFGRYGFNKSHSVAYSILSYQTAWLKAHYPAEFMAALLSSEIGNTDKVVQYINEARELDLEILPPDVNESGFKFTVVGERRIRFGLGAVRNVGEGAIASIIAGRRGRRPTSPLGGVGGADRPPALQQAGARVAGGRRRVRLARRSSEAADRGARARAGRGPAAPGGAGGGTGVALRRGREGGKDGKRTRATATDVSAFPPSRHSRLDRGRTAGQGEGGARASSSRGTRWSASARRSSCSAPAPRPPWASGASTR